MIQKIKGTMDILPAEAALFRHIEGVMREEAARLPEFREAAGIVTA